jgi:hypothetical protein
MSPRRNHPRRRGSGRRSGRHDPAGAAELDLVRARRGGEAVETWLGEPWRVRQIPGGGALKAYRCPGCDQEIRPGVPHLVVWPVADPPVADPAGGLADRRHWHAGCWQARDRRRPTGGRRLRIARG